jgi:polyhydroxybutyrate depolymerase
MNRMGLKSIVAAMIFCFLTSFVECGETAIPAMLNAGDQDFTLKHDGRDRTYLLHIPPQHDGVKALPLVMFFHGGMGTANHAAATYGWNEKADKEGFLVVYPNGTGAIQTWNAMHGCGSAFKNNVDDVGFVKALLEDLNSKVKIDPKQIFATGMSNGGMLSHRLAAEMSQVFAAVAPVAGAIGGKENAGATEKRIPLPANPVPMIIFHGKADQNVLYDGGETKGGAERGRIDLSVAEAVNFWVKADGCNATPKKEELNNGNVIKESYTSENGAEVLVFTIVDGGHAWPGSKRLRLKASGNKPESISATDTAWDFFVHHPRK